MKSLLVFSFSSLFIASAATFALAYLGAFEVMPEDLHGWAGILTGAVSVVCGFVIIDEP